MFADLRNFDNLRRNTWDVEAIIEIHFATAGQKFSSHIIIARPY